MQSGRCITATKMSRKERDEEEINSAFNLGLKVSQEADLNGAINDGSDSVQSVS